MKSDFITASPEKRKALESVLNDGKPPANEKTAAKIEENKAKYAAAKNRKEVSA